MKPLFGVVTRASRRILVIRLESGKLVETDNSRLKLHRYDTVEIHYDYTRNEIVDVVECDTNREVREGTGESKIKILEVGQPNEDHLESLVETDSGALYLSGDEYWDPESGLLCPEQE